jgi:hypothetical protein
VALEDEVEADLDNLGLVRAGVRVRERIAGCLELREQRARHVDVHPALLRRPGLYRHRRRTWCGSRREFIRMNVLT